jgi:hypothetical protein
MSISNRNERGYSADVRMQLCVNGHVHTIGQLGPDFLILDDPTDHPPAEAEIILSIDGRVRRWSVQLPDGIRAGQPETRIVGCPASVNGSTVG